MPNILFYEITNFWHTLARYLNYIKQNDTSFINN